MKAMREIGWRKTLKFGFFTILHAIYSLLLFSPFRILFLRLMGAKIGSGVVLHAGRFFNLYRKGFRGLHIGNHCFLGDEYLIDLAEEIVLEESVTLAERVTILTHTNVGYADHPLQKYIPSSTAPVVLRRGSFVGTNATILPGVEIGECAVVAAGALVRSPVSAYCVVGGVPSKVIKVLKNTR